MKYEGLIYTQGQYPRPNESKDSFEIELSEEPVVGRGSRETQGPSVRRPVNRYYI